MKDKLTIFNPVGLLTGVLMLILPFQGVWWEAILGNDVLRIAFSPFEYDLSLAGQAITSPLVGYFLLAAKIMIILGGVFMIIGSIGASRWWGKKLIDWGKMRVFWMVILLIIILLIGTLLMNNYFTSIISGFVEGGSTVQLDLPYLVGSGQATVIAQEGVEISGPLRTGFTSSFWLAIVTAGMGIGAKFYQDKYVKEEESEEKQEDKSVEKEDSEEKEKEKQKE